MFQNSPQPLIFRYLHRILIGLILVLLSTVTLTAQEPAPYGACYNPITGFKPVQSNLTKVFLQMAGSLEHFGTPAPYIRHVMAEHVRIDSKHLASGGKGSSRPAYLTDEYVDNLIANWDKISPPLKLDMFCREAGRNVRYAILGSKNMSVAELVKLEEGLGQSEQDTYRKLLEKQYFTKSDMPEVNVFYGSPYEKLSEIGKEQMSRRTWLGTQSPDVRKKQLEAPPAGTALVSLFNEHQDNTVAFLEDRRKPKATADTFQQDLIGFLKLGAELDLPKGTRSFDAEPLIYAHKIRTGFIFRTDTVTKQAKTPEQAENVNGVMRLMLENLAIITQSEFEAAICESSSKLRQEQ